jgi:hypothetical protein
MIVKDLLLLMIIKAPISMFIPNAYSFENSFKIMHCFQIMYKYKC